jgi:hypothetical protein
MAVGQGEVRLNQKYKEGRIVMGQVRGEDADDEEVIGTTNARDERSFLALLGYFTVSGGPNEEQT